MGLGPVRVDDDAVRNFWAAVAQVDVAELNLVDAYTSEMSTGPLGHVTRQLKVVHAGLLLTLGSPRSGERPRLIISAGGLRELFPVVFAVVDAAPVTVVEAWDVRALRPRGEGTDFVIKLNSVQLSTRQVKWEATAQRGRPTVADLDIYCPGLIEALPPSSTFNERRVQIVFTLLDHLVGEWGCEMQIGAISWHGDTDRALPALTELPAFLDRLAAQ